MGRVGALDAIGGHCRGGRRSALFAALLCCACAPAEPPPSERTVYARLFAADATPQIGKVLQCGVGGELRQTLGCLGNLQMRPVVGESDDQSLRFQVGRALRGRELLVERRSRRDPLDPWRHLPSLLVRARPPELKLDFPAPEGHERRTEFHPAPAPNRTHRSETVAIPWDARLQGGVAFAPTHLSGPSPSIEMRIDAHADGETRTLWQQRVDPAQLQDTWLDYEIDLAGLAGRPVSFSLSSTTTAPTEAAARSFPLWSHPRIVAPQADDSPEALRHVVLISIDTLRADHVGVYGSLRATTPNLDAFARQAVVFETAMSTSPATTASHMSMLTGLYPLVHRVYQPRVSLSRSIPTLAEQLARRGWSTGAVTENGMVHAYSGFGRGFDYYREFKGATTRETTGHIEQVVAAGLRWLERHRNEKTFLFLHTYEVHGPYAPPAEFDLFASAEATRQGERDARAYAGEVLYADHVMGRLFDALRQLDLFDSSLIIVTADHGEDFGKHSWGHGFSLHEEAVRIPLMIRAPARLPAARRSAPVSLVDVTPTILELVGISPEVRMQGRSLVPLALDANAAGFADRAIHAERLDGDQLAIRRQNTKWILTSRPEPGPSVYDLSADADETNPGAAAGVLAEGERLAAARRADANALREELHGARTAPVRIDDETTRELRALGYIE